MNSDGFVLLVSILGLAVLKPKGKVVKARKNPDDNVRVYEIYKGNQHWDDRKDDIGLELFFLESSGRSYKEWFDDSDDDREELTDSDIKSIISRLINGKKYHTEIVYDDDGTPWKIEVDFRNKSLKERIQDILNDLQYNHDIYFSKSSNNSWYHKGKDYDIRVSDHERVYPSDKLRSFDFVIYGDDELNTLKDDILEIVVT